MNFAFHPDAEDEFNSAIDYCELKHRATKKCCPPTELKQNEI